MYDYKPFLNEVVKVETALLGKQVMLDILKRILQLKIDSEGSVLEYSGDVRDILRKITLECSQINPLSKIPIRSVFIRCKLRENDFDLDYKEIIK